MPKEHRNDIRLGIFLIAGIAVLAFSLYMIGRDQSFFAGGFRLKARFRDVAGLMVGNNVRYSGIQNGTVKSILILDDTTIEVTMSIDKQARTHIRKNSLAMIGTEGLMGNKVINIGAGDPNQALASDGDILPTRSIGNLGEAVNTLYRTNDNAAVIAEQLVATMKMINSSPVLNRLLSDTSLSENLHSSLENLRQGSERLKTAIASVEQTISGVQAGKGALGLLMSDNESRARLADALSHIQLASHSADSLVFRLNQMTTGLQKDLDREKGLIPLLLRDTSLVGQLVRSMENIEQGTADFHSDMESLQHNFLTRPYFRRLERKAGKQ